MNGGTDGWRKGGISKQMAGRMPWGLGLGLWLGSQGGAHRGGHRGDMGELPQPHVHSESLFLK